MKKKTVKEVSFSFSGIAGRALVEGKNVLIKWAGQRFHLATASVAMRSHVIKQLSIAGAL